MTDTSHPLVDLGDNNNLLIVDDDRPFLQRLARAMESRGFSVEMAESVVEAAAKVKVKAPDFAVVDMRLNDGNGLDVIESIRNTKPDCKAIIFSKDTGLYTFSPSILESTSTNLHLQ